MGGCRCTFRECQNNSANTLKMVHFFHYPHKDHERVKLWCVYSNNESFLALPADKLRNKVVCENHFRIECFMNSNKERLIRTAVPTLMTTNFGGVVDLEKYNMPHLDTFVTRDELESLGVEIECELPAKSLEDDSETEEGLEIVLHNNHLPKQQPIGSEITLSIDSIESLHTQELVMEEELTTPSPKFPPRLIRVPRPKFLNREITMISLPPTTPTSTPPAKRPKIENSTPKPASVQSVPVSRNSIYEISSTEGQEQRLDTRSEANTALLSELAQMKDAMKQQIDCYADFKSFLTESVVSMETSSSSVKNQLEHSKNQLLVTQNHLVESQKLLAKTQKQLTDLMAEQKSQRDSTMAQFERLSQLPQSTMNSSVDADSGKLEKNSMKKVQLFNGIKRYLNPAAVALLRMEMFGSAERPYKSDEKNFAVELLNFGDETYNYFTDEWRFRLPPKQAVKTWINEVDDEDDV